LKGVNRIHGDVPGRAARVIVSGDTDLATAHSEFGEFPFHLAMGARGSSEWA
jgi:hypothetical protein